MEKNKLKDWKEVELKEISIKITKGTTPTTVGGKYEAKGINYIKSECLIDQKQIDNKKISFISNKIHDKLKRSHLYTNDILLSIAGAYLGKTAIVYKKNVPANTNQAVGIIRLDESKVYSDYIYYFLNTRQTQYFIKNCNSQSAQPNINLTQIGKISVKLPPLPTQKRIAAVLSALDDKIELNQQMNQTLERTAQTLFKSWFVDFDPVIDNALAAGNEIPKLLREKAKRRQELDGKRNIPEHIRKLFPAEFTFNEEKGWIPKGWGVKELGKCLKKLESGKRPKGGAKKSGIPSIGAENILGLGKYDFSKEKYVTREYFENMKKGIIKSKDVLLYKDGAKLGRKSLFMNGFPHEECCINSHVYILITNELLTQFYLYFYLDLKKTTEDIKNLNTNSAQPGINQKNLKMLHILVPNYLITEKYSDLIESNLNKIFENCLENKNLTKLRDTLLPKLMNGEIDVGEVEI